MFLWRSDSSEMKNSIKIHFEEEMGFEGKFKKSDWFLWFNKLEIVKLEKKSSRFIWILEKKRWQVIIKIKIHLKCDTIAFVTAAT